MRLATITTLVLLASLAQARAQEPERSAGVTIVTDRQLAMLPAATAEGGRYSLTTARWRGLRGDAVLLQASALDGCLVVRDPALLDGLSRGVDSDGVALVARRTNVQVIGLGLRTPLGFGLLVTRVRALEGDLESGTRRAAALAPGDAPGRVELARELRERVALYLPRPVLPDDVAARRDLVQLASRLEQDAGALALGPLPDLPGGAAERIARGLERRSIGALALVWADARVSGELRERAARGLRDDLKAQLYVGRWYSDAELLDVLDLERAPNGELVPRARAAFVRACLGQLARMARGEPLESVPAGLLAQATVVVQGMRKDLVLELTGAYPARVDRLRMRGLVFEEWALEDGTLIRFLNGVVFARVD